MNTDTVRLNITLPKNLLMVIDQMSGPRKRSAFISEAIELKIKQTRQEALKNQLVEGYQDRRQESLDLSSEFEPADLEGWDDY